jgi:hypothetical protein
MKSKAPSACCVIRPAGAGIDGSTMNPNYRNFALWVIIFLLVVALLKSFHNL